MQQPAQLRFAKSLGTFKESALIGPPSKGKGKKKSKKNADSDSNLVLSSEMENWLEATFEEVDQEGYLKDTIGSVLTRPLDSMAAFCPTASILTSSTAAPRIPTSASASTRALSSAKFSTKNLEEPNEESRQWIHGKAIDSMEVSSTIGFAERTITENLLTTTTNINEEPPPPFIEAVNCLEVMWLKRRAMLEEEDGDIDKALKTLESAIELHLGTTDYSKARLADPVVSSDPAELVQQIEETYVPYDTTPHLAAERVQRIFRRYFGRRWRAATKLEKICRGFLVRRPLKNKHNMLSQCAFLIQRRFRGHLRKIHYYATKIKVWYKTRCQMFDYRKMLYIFRSARKIQRRWRGIVGRRKGYIVKLRIVSAMRIQRNIRSYFVRIRRALAISMCHRVYYRIARKIQNRFRIIYAIRRAQLRLIGVVIEEQERMQEEEEIYEEAIRIEMDKLTLYLKTDAGKLHLRDSSDTIKAKNNAFNKIKHTLPEEDILARDATIAFELFDADGSGEIDIDELNNMLMELAIPMERPALEDLFNEMDDDGGGSVDFNEFKGWYIGGGNKSSGGVGNMFFKQLLRARSLVMELTGITLAKRAERDVLRQCTTWVSRDTQAMYRLQHPPKFSCCQCHEPFVLFSDYYSHFDENQLCPEKKERGIFFLDFSNQQDWTYQRMLEYEINRERDETPCLEYAATMAIFEDIAIQNDRNFKLVVQTYSRAAMYIFVEKYNNEKNTKGLADFMVDIVDMTRDGILRPYIAKSFGRILNKDIPPDWLVEDNWTIDEFKAWVQSLYGESDPVVDENGFRSRIKNVCFPSNVEVKSAILGYLYFITLRMLIVVTEAELGALMDLREKRPRKITIPDSILESLDLTHLTETNYNSKRKVLVTRLKDLHAKMQELVVLSLRPKPPCCACLGFVKVTNPYASVSPDDLSESAFKELRILDAHNNAAARLRSYVKSRVGKSQIGRMASELWAMRERIKDENPHSSPFKNNLIYRFDLLSSPSTNEGIDINDIDLFEKLFSLKLKHQTANVIKYLDPYGIGFLELKPLERWFRNEMHLQYINSIRQYATIIGDSIKHLIFMFYSDHAKLRCLAMFRKISRLDIELHHRTMIKYMKAAENDGQSSAEKEKGDKVIDISEKGGSGVSVVLSIASVEDNMKENLQTLKAEYKKGEDRLIFRLTEDDAEMVARKHFFSRVGRYQLKHEKMLLGASSIMLQAYGFCIPPSKKCIPRKQKKHDDSVDQLNSIDDEDNGSRIEEINQCMTNNVDLVGEPIKKEEELPPEEEHDVFGQDNSSIASQDDFPEQNVNDVDQSLEDQGHDINSDLVNLFQQSSVENFSNSYVELSDNQNFIENEELNMNGEVSGSSVSGSQQQQRLLDDENSHQEEVATSTVQRLLLAASSMIYRLLGQNGSGINSRDDLNVDIPEVTPIHDCWKLAISMIVYTFDTDCSGTFDESEVKLLLHYLLCGLSEKRLLYAFPEVNHDSATLDSILDYLVSKVYWIKGLPDLLSRDRPLSVLTMSAHSAAAMLLISFSRQAARELAEQTMVMQAGVLVEEDDTKKEDAVIVRSQMFAMRQVELFLRTIHGKLHTVVELDTIKYLFAKDVLKERFSKIGLLRYAYQVHSCSKGMLITEFPHLIRFIVLYLKLRPNENLEDITPFLTSVKSKADLRFLSRDDVMSLVENAFDDPFVGVSAWPQRSYRNILLRMTLKSHAVCHVYSKARQQAVLISLDAVVETNCHVAETNYRCCILGLDAVKKRTLKSKLWRGLTKGEIGRDKSIGWFTVPREATMLLLLSRGYTMADMTLERTQKVVGSYHPNGDLCDDLVDVEQVIFNSRRDEAFNMNIFQSAYRWLRFPFGLPRYFEYKRTVAVLTKHRKEITLIGAMFLKELVAGTSHCGEVEFLKENVI